MRIRNTISRVVLAALLLVLLPLWSDGATSLLAAETATGLCLKKKAGPGTGEAVLNAAASGAVTAIRRGEEPLPSGHGNSPAAGTLPGVPGVSCFSTGTPVDAAWSQPAPVFVRMQAKLLFPKHGFW